MTTGKDKADFPGAFIPFDKSVGPVPTVSIDSAPTVQLCVNEDWLPFVVTCLKALARPETWSDTYDNSVIAASEFAALVASISKGCGVKVPSKMCISGTFADDQYGFVPDPGSDCVATWVSGTGWEMCANSTPQGFLDIKREFGTTTLIREVHLTIETTAPYLINYDVVLYDAGDFVSVASATGVTGPTIQIDATGLSQPASAIFIHILEPLGGAAADSIITNWGLCYTGAFPLSLPDTDTYTHVFDFTVSDGGWTERTSGEATYISSEGWEHGSVTDNVRCVITHGVASGGNVRSVQVEYDWAFGTGNLSIAGHRIATLTGGSVINQVQITSQGSSQIALLTVDDFPDQLEVNIYACEGASCASGSVTIRKITVTGHGTDPF